MKLFYILYLINLCVTDVTKRPEVLGDIFCRLCDLQCTNQKQQYPQSGEGLTIQHNKNINFISIFVFVFPMKIVMDVKIDMDNYGRDHSESRVYLTSLCKCV